MNSSVLLFFHQYYQEMSNIRRARLEGADRYGGSNRFCGGVVSARLCATYGAHADGTDPEMVDLNGPQ